MKKYIYLLFLILVLIPTHAQKRAFELDDIYKIKSVGSPVLSHNGDKIAFTVTSYDLKESKSITKIFTANIDGSGLEQFTDDSLSYYNPLWCLKDTGLYYVSYNDKNSKILFKKLHNNEVVTVAESYLSIESPKLSPDGKSFIFTTKLFPECGAEAKCNEIIQEAMDEGPIQAHLADSLFVRHWTEYEDGQYSHVLLYNIENKSYTDLTPGYFYSPTFSPGGSDDYEFAPDSKSIVFSSKRVSSPELSTNSDVWIVSTDGTRLKNITTENKAYDGSGQFSPDGKYITYRKQNIPGYESDMWNLALYNISTGQHKVLTNEIDNWVNSFQWSSDSKTIYFDLDEKGYNPLLKVNVETGKIDRVMEKSSINSWIVNNDESKVIYSYSKVEQPTEIAIYDLMNGKSTDITSVNSQLMNEVDFRPVESLWVDGADGAKIQVFVVKPHNFDPNKKYPLIVNVHGGPQMMWRDSYRPNWQLFPGSGYIIAFPNGHGSSGYGQAFTRDISQGWGGNIFTDILKVTDYLETLPYVDRDKVGAMGWSYGGYFMNLLQAKTKRYKCFVSMMGIYDLDPFYLETEEQWFPQFDLGGAPWENKELYKKYSPSTYVEDFSTPTLIITGERDYRVPYYQSLRYFTALQLKGIDSRIIIFDNDGHWPDHLKSMPLYYNSHLEWFNKYLDGKPAPYDSEKMVRNLAY